MTSSNSCDQPSADPLRVMFITTSMPIGGAETLLVNLVRRFDPTRFTGEICCLKEPGPLGEQIAGEVPVHSRLSTGKFDIRVFWRLRRLLLQRRIDAVVTVGAGDKMFWGRLAARAAGVPVVCCALHSTGWPDVITPLNRRLTAITDAFIGVAAPHGRHLVEVEGFPREKVHVIANGVDTDRFRPRPEAGARLRSELGITADAPVCGIVAALRPEKNHALFLQAAARVRRKVPAARFLIVGDGPQQSSIEAHIAHLELRDCVHLLGSRGDVPEVLSMCDAFMLTSQMEANPVSILEAMAVGLPIVSTRCRQRQRKRRRRSHRLPRAGG